MFENYLAVTFRNLAKNKLFASINILGIGLAISCCIVAYFNRQFNENWDNGHKYAAEIYRVQFFLESDNPRNKYATAPLPMGNYIRENLKNVNKVVRLVPEAGDFRIKDETFGAPVGYVDASFFEIFTYGLVSGDFGNLKDKSKIFISDELANKYFNREDVTGEPLTQVINGKPKEFIIGGVFKKQPLNSSFYFQTFTLIDNYWERATDTNENDWKQFCILFLQIDNPEQLTTVTKQLQQYIEPQNKAREDFRVKEFYLENFKVMASHNRKKPRVQEDYLRGGLPDEAITVPSVMAMFLLLLACFNFTNTSIALSSKRLKEIGIRKVVGGNRKQIIVQFLGENLILCFLGLIVGLILAEFLVPAYDSLWNWLELDYSYSDNIQFFFFLLILLLFTALTAGAYPSFYIASFQPNEILKGGVKFGSTNWFTRILLGLQFFISLLAVIFAVVFNANAIYQSNYDLGYTTSKVISVPINDGDYKIYHNSLSTNKDIKIIAGTKDHLITSTYNGSVKYQSVEKMVDIIDIGNDYIDAMDIEIIDGRNFLTDSEVDRNSSILVTEELAKQFKLSNPVGKQLIWQDTISLNIIGVVKNIYSQALWGPVQPLMIRNVSEKDYRTIIVSTSPDKLREVNEFMEARWKELFPYSVYRGRRTDSVMAETIETNINIVTVFTFLGFFAILLSASGLYTLVSLNILKKMKNIGMRKILGASIWNILIVINREFIITLIVASILGGAAGYFATTKILDVIWDYYKELNLQGLILSVSIVFIVAILSVGYKSLTAAKTNPVKNLRD